METVVDCLFNRANGHDACDCLIDVEVDAEYRIWRLELYPLLVVDPKNQLGIQTFGYLKPRFCG